MHTQVCDTHTNTHVHVHAKTHTPAAKNERNHANPQMCRMKRGEMRKGGLGGGVECLEGGKGRGVDRGGESGGEGWVFTTV